MKAFIATLICASTAVSIAADSSAAQAASKRVIISFNARSSEAQRNAVLQAVGAKRVFSIASNGNSDDEFMAAVAEVPAGTASSLHGSVLSDPSSQSGAKSLMEMIPAASQAAVLDIEDDFNVQWIETTPQPIFPSMPALMENLPKLKLNTAAAANLIALATIRPEITWGIDRVKAPSAWDATQGAGVRVAVIDTGIDSSHEDLQGKVDGGYDAISKSEQKTAWQDGHGHGTHVAGTIGALRDGHGVVGVAPKVRLYAVRVLGKDGSGDLSSIIDGIIWCAKNGIQVANMSLGSSMPSEAMQKALRYAKSRGVVIVASAGNSGGPVGFPGAYPEVIGVAASDADDKVAAFSSRGPEVDFIAPGVYVVSTAMGGGYASFSGTSMAAPHVSGLAALAVSQGWVGLDGPDGVLAQLKKAARPLDGLTPLEQGFGMIDAGRLSR